MEKKYGYEIFYGKVLFMDNGDMTFPTKRAAYKDAVATILDCLNDPHPCYNEMPDPMNNDLEIYVFEIKEN